MIDVPKVGRPTRRLPIFSVHELARRYELICVEHHHIVNDWRVVCRLNTNTELIIILAGHNPVGVVHVP